MASQSLGATSFESFENFGQSLLIEIDRVDMSRFSFAGKQFDPETFELVDEKGTHTLRAKTAGLLTLFLQHPDEPLSRAFLLDQNWGGVAVGDHVLSETLRELRAHLGDSPRRPQFIRTIPKHGYQWIWEAVEVTTLEREMPPRVPDVEEGDIRLGDLGPSGNGKSSKLWYVGLGLLAVLLSIALWLQRPQNHGQPMSADQVQVTEKTTPRLGILPLQDGSLDSSWFDDGYQDLLLLALSDVAELEIADGKYVREQAQRIWTTEAVAEAFEPAQFANLLGLSDVLRLSIHRDEEVCRIHFQLTDGAGSLRKQGQFSALNQEEAVMALAGVLAKIHQVPLEKLQVAKSLEGMPEVQSAFTRGVHYANSGMAKRAAEQFQFCLRRVPEFHWARYKLANAQFKMGEMETSQQHLEHVLQHPDAGIRLKSHVLNTMGAQQLNRGELAAAEASFENAAAQFLQIGAHDSHLKSLGNHVVAAMYQQKTQLAIQLLNQGLKLAEKLGLKSQKSQFLSRAAGLQLMEGNREAARTSLNQARILYRQLGDLGGVAEVNNNLGVIALEQEDPEQADPYFKLAWRQYEDLERPIQAALALHNQGTCAYMRGELAKAETLTNTAKGARERHKDKFGLGESHAQLALIHAAAGRDEGSLAEMKIAEQIYDELGRPDITLHYVEKLILKLLTAGEKTRAQAFLQFYPDAPSRPPGLEVTLLLAEAAMHANETETMKHHLEQALKSAPREDWSPEYVAMFATYLPTEPSENPGE